MSGTPVATVVLEPNELRDVLAHDAALGQDVGAVGAVARERAGGLLGDLGDAGGGGRRVGGRGRGRGRGRARRRAGVAARGEAEAEPGEPHAHEDAPAVDEGVHVEGEALVPRRLGGVGEGTALEGGDAGVGGAADRAVMADSCATPRGTRCVQEGSPSRLAIA